jgi:hypothetical protein
MGLRYICALLFALLTIFLFTGCAQKEQPVNIAPEEIIQPINKTTDSTSSDSNKSNADETIKDDTEIKKDTRKYKTWTDISGGLPKKFKAHSIIEKDGILFMSVANEGVYRFTGNSWVKMADKADSTYGISELIIDDEGFFYTLTHGDIYRLSQDRSLWGCLTCQDTFDYDLYQMITDGENYYFKAKYNKIEKFVFLQATGRDIKSFIDLNFPYSHLLDSTEMGSQFFYEDNALWYSSADTGIYKYDIVNQEWSKEHLQSGDICIANGNPIVSYRKGEKTIIEQKEDSWKKILEESCQNLRCISLDDSIAFITEKKAFVLDGGTRYELSDLNADIDKSLVEPTAVVIDNIISVGNTIYLTRTFNKIAIINIDKEYIDKNLQNKIFAISIDTDLLKDS